MSINKEFMIFNLSEVDNINFDEVIETSKETLSKSVDNTKTFVKWNGNIPLSVQSLVTKEGPYTYEEILSILSTSEWSSQIIQ
jgi:hypothetical protein